MERKFNKYDFVQVVKKGSMCYGDTAIIDGSYGDLCWGNDHSQFAVYIVYDDKIAYRISWFSENQLDLLDRQDAQFAEMLVDEYVNK